jgi:tetratricopeptide (TPR) repeat protein
VYRATFSPDGRLALTANWDKTARLWEVGITPAPDDLPRLQTWVRVRTGKTFDKQGALQRMRFDDWLQDWKDWQQQGKAWEPSPNAERWHQACAREAEAAQQWFAALFHLQRLLRGSKESIDLRLRRARAYAQLSRWPEALADYNRVLKARPDDPEALKGRAKAQAELDR